MIHIIDNQKFEYRFLSAGRSQITGEFPRCKISNITTETPIYWNGMEWQDLEFQLSMRGGTEGVYTYSFPIEKGLFKIEAYDTVFEQKDVVMLEAVEGLVGLPGEEVELILEGMPTSKNFSVSIKRISDNYYLNAGGTWQIIEEFLEIQESPAGTYKKPLKYDSEETFELSIKEETIPHASTQYLNFRKNANEKPIETLGDQIGSDTTLTPNGESSIILDDSGCQMKDVEVTIFVRNSNEVYRCFSDKNGKWANNISDNSDYVVIFKKDGFLGTAIEKVGP